MGSPPPPPFPVPTGQVSSPPRTKGTRRVHRSCAGRGGTRVRLKVGLTLARAPPVVTPHARPKRPCAKRARRAQRRGTRAALRNLQEIQPLKTCAQSPFPPGTRLHRGPPRRRAGPTRARAAPELASQTRSAMSKPPAARSERPSGPGGEKDTANTCGGRESVLNNLVQTGYHTTKGYHKTKAEAARQ